MKHEHTATKLESSASLVRNKYKKTEYSIFYDMDGDYNIESRASFVCPGIHAVSAKLNTRMIDTPMTAGVEVEWSPTEKVTLNGELTNYGLRYIDTTVRLTTPIRDLERIVLTGRHGKDDGVWTSRAALEYAPRREIEVRTKYSSDDKLLGEIIITAPFRSFQKFKVSGDYSGDYRRAINGNFQLEQRPQLGRFDVIGSYKNGRQKTANLRINTPLRDIPYSEVRGTYQPGSVQLEVEYLPNKVVNINSEYRMGNTNDLSGELTITTPIASFDYLKTSILHRGSRYRSRSVATLEYPRREEYSATLNYENDDKIDVSLDLKAPEYDDVRLSVSHSGTGRNFDSHVMLTFQKYKKIEGDLIFSLKRGSKGPMMSVESIAKSPYYEDFNLKLTHEGNIVDFKTNLVSSYGRRNRLTYNVGAVTSPDSIHTNTDLELTSDIIKPQSAAAVFNLKGELRDFKGNFEGNYQGRTIDSSISSKLSRGIEAEFTLNTPFQAAKDISLSIKQSGDMRQFNSIAKAQYNRKAFESDVSFSKIRGSVDGRVTVKTPIRQLEDLSSSFHFGGDLKNMQGSSRIQYARGKEIEVSGNVDLSGERRQIAVTIHTPFQDYETLSASGNLTGRLTNFLFNSRVQYANRKSLAVESKVNLEDRRKVMDGTITTPFYGYERLAASVNIDGDLNHFTSNSNVDYGRGKRIESDIKVNTLDRLKRASIRITTPFENFRENSASVELQGDRSQFSAKADITYLNSQRISISSSANLNSNPKSASAVVRTPFDGFEEISVVSNFNGYSKHFKSDSRITYAPQKSIELDASVDLEGGKKTISGMIKTPFEGYKQMSIAGDYEKRPSKHQADVIVEYAPGKKIEVDGRLTLQDKRKGLRLSAKTPLDGFESISGKINFNGVPERFDGDGEVQYGRNQKIVVNCNVDVKSARKSVSVSAKTPFDGFEDVSASVTRSGELKFCQMEGSVSYGNGKTLTLNTGLDILSDQKTANVQITTPYPGFETQGVSLTVDGSPLNFQTSATLESSKLDKPILARAALNYQSPTRMDSTFSFTSAIPKAENLRLVLKNADDRQYTSHVEAQWSLRKSITLDGSFEKVNRWRSSRMIADISISTPFENARKLATHLENSLSKVKRSIVLNIDHENRNILAAKLEREDDGKMSANIDMPHPRPMKFNAEGTVNSNLVAHSVYLNWDVRDPSSNIKVSTEYKDGSNAYSIDKEMSLKISRAEQTLAIASKLEKSSYKLVSSASVALDDIKASLETELNDRSRGYTKMYHGKVRLNTPYKVLQLEASHSDDLEKITSETTWYWDAERDQSKKIILSSVLQKSASFLKSDLKLQAPSIRKEIRLTSQASLNQGRTIFDGRSELSYSPDSRQTLAITTKIEKTGSEYDDNSNYSVSVGLSHPSTNTDVKVVSHAGQSDSRMSAGAQVIYLNSRRQQKNMELRGEIDRLRKEIHLEVLSPMKSVDIKGKLRTDKSYDLTLHNVYDKSKSIDTSVVIDPEQGNIAISMGSDLNNPSNTVNLRAGYLADNILSVEAYHMSRQGRTTDGLVALTLNTSRILHTRLHWRPSVISEIKRELDRRGRIYQERAESSLAGVLDEIRQELSTRADRVVNDMEGHVTPIVDVLSDASNSLDVEVALLLDKLDKLGMKEALAAAEDVIDSIIKLADQTLEEMSESYDMAKEKITEIYHSAASRLEKYEEILAEASELAREYQVEVENFVKKSLVKIIHEIERLAEASRYHYHKVAEEGRELARASLAKAKDVLDRTLSHPKVKMMKAKLSDLLDKIPELAKPEKIKEISRRVQNMAKSYKVSFANKYIDMIAGAHKTISENVDKLMQRDELRRVHAVANEVYQQGKWAYDYWEVEKNVVEGMRSLVKKIKDMASAEIREHWDSIARLEEWRLVVYNPQGGEIQFEMYLPVALKSLRALPDASIPKIKKTYKKFSNGFKYLKNYNLADTYYSLKPSSDVANWIPPFKAYASVSGKQHFTTFDGRSYEFAGLCSYVLAQDFMDGNFSVILHYDGDWANVQKRSLTVTAGNKRIDIFPDYRVQVDNRPQELPYQYNSVIATRLGNTIRVDTGKGLVVECDLANDLYTVTVSGWFFGKTAGLFGTYDNEPSNDFVMPSRRITEDIGEFAHSWEVGGSCRSNKNFAKAVPLETGKAGFERCSDLYLSSGSPFRPCFRQVSAQNAFSNCMYDHSMESSSTAICGSVALHRMQCGQKGVTLPTPPQCVTCETPNGGMFATGKDLILSADGIRPPKSADIVFVIEEKECNKKASGELQSVAESVDSALRRQGLTRNLYGIVGYGGFDASNSPLSHTIGGKIMNDARRFGVGADSLSFERKGGVADVMEAVMFASKYPFRTGVSKSIVLMPCSSCETRYVGFEETEQLLKSRGITLHLLKKHDFEFRSNRSPKSTNIFGIDNEGAYSYGGKGQKMAADSNLLTKLRVPSDNCIALAKSTNGKMFNLARLIEGRQRMQRSFRDVWSKSIAQSAEPMSCQECRCVDNSNGVGVSICNQCDKSSYKSAMPIGRLDSRPRYRTPNQSDDFGSQLKEYLSVRQE